VMTEGDDRLEHQPLVLMACASLASAVPCHRWLIPSAVASSQSDERVTRRGLSERHHLWTSP
jgi:hypothetical protein